jgi:signal transduction histidine kinase
MWIYDAETLAILEVNEAAGRVYGYTRDEFLALTTTDVAPAEEGEPSARAWHQRKDGSEIEVRTIEHAVTFGDRPARVVLAEDVGERERLESQLRQAQRMEAIGRLAGGVAHDFNNLLTAVIGFSDLALAHTPQSDPRRDELEEIKKAGERAVALTRQLLAFSRGQVLEPVVLELNEGVGSIEPMLRRLVREDIKVETRLKPEVGRVKVDRGQLEQVIVNLVVNAADAMPGGGRLSIETVSVNLDEEYIRLHPAAHAEPGRFAVLEITDTGVGMDEETMSHIFEPFFTTKGEEGTGLGLATVYGIVRQSGGFVWVYSEPGRGTSFKVYLPSAEAPVERERPISPVKQPVPSGCRVLLVEDDPLVRTLVRRILTSYDFEILEAATGDEALALSSETEADALDLLITDTVMPGVGGIELAERIRARHPTLRTVIMSGYSEALTSGEVTLPPGTEFVAKPFSPTDLTAKLESLLATPVGGAPA